MKVKKGMKRVIAMLLVIATVGTGSGISTMAESTKAKNEKGKTTEKTQKEQALSPDEVAQQIADGTYKGRKLKETKYYDTYEAADGSVVAAYYSSPIRYEDENGELQEYDSNLIETDNKKASYYTGEAMSESFHTEDYAYVNAKGNSKQYFPEKLAEESPILMENGAHSLAFVPEIDDKKVSKEKSEKDDTENKKETTSDNVVKASKDKVEYVEDDVTYQYVSLDNGVKENVIINNKTDELLYSFSYTLDGMHMKLDKKTNIIGLYDNKTKKEVAVIPAAYLNDSTGTNTNYDIKTKIKNSGNLWTVTYELPESYMNDMDTAYPVTLDPTVEWVTYANNENPLGISFVIELSPGSGDTCQYPNAVNRFVVGRSGAGDYYKTYIKFNKLNKLLQGKQVNYAYAYFNVAQQVGGDMTVDMHEVTENWNLGTLKWSNEPASDSEVLSQAVIGTEKLPYQIDFTKYCTMVAEEEADAMEGVELRTEEKSKYMEFWGVKSQSGAPVFIVSYNSPEEIDATYDGSFEIGAEYNEESKKIDVSWEDSKQAATLYRVYKRTENKFEYVGKTTEKTYEVGTDDIESVADIRVMAVDQKGTQLDTTDDVNVLSNIVTFEKKSETQKNDTGEEVTTTTYEQTTVDTDGDGLEDGYEIWDFKTFWNTETKDSTKENPKYEQDSDGDGLPDGYEVFTLGTDPAVANESGEDSDSDGWTDVKEYQKGTDPWLYDSDFDGLRDKDDAGDNNPRKTDNPRIKGTDKSAASAAQVHKGLYDREYSETENDVTVTYIVNIYRGDIKSIYNDYGNTKLNKRLKYFYDADGNNTAIIEQYDDNDTQTICITYTYDEHGNVEFICDQQTKYTMEYNSDNKITNLQVGDKTLVSYEYNSTVNNLEEEKSDESVSETDSGAKIKSQDEQITYYGSGADRQKVKTVTTEYKVAEDNKNAVAEQVEVFYDDETKPSYVTSINAEGKIITLTDNTEDKQSAYSYEYTDNSTKITRSDGFIKEVTQDIDEDNNKSTLESRYTYKSLTDEEKTRVSKVETDASDNEKIESKVTLYNDDVINGVLSNDGKSDITSLYSNTYKKNIVKYSSVEDSPTHRTFDIEKYGEDKNIDYTYDKAGNITKIKIDGTLTYAYEYDAHGRLTWEYDYDTSRAYEYGYTTTGNVEAKHTYDISDADHPVELDDEIKTYTYKNGDWPDQLTKYCGNTITYDSSGNPKEYYNGISFSWYRGRQLKEATLENRNKISYKYNEDGFRTYKDTAKTTSVYEWDDSKLLRETVTYKQTGKKYDLWYMYDANDSVVGFEYSQISETDSILKTTRIYFEKNLQGDVIGLLDARGAEIAVYTYDAWGNVITDSGASFCYEGYEVPFELNHVLYRSYYYDGSCNDSQSDTNLYYLQSRYYDPEVGRFINADDINMLGIEMESIFKDNLYIYCNSDPINNIDPSGYLYISLKTLAKIVVYAIGFNPTATVLLYLGYKILKAKLSAKVARLTAKIGSICGPAGRLVGWAVGFIGAWYFLGPFVSALWDCVMQGKKGIQVELKKSRWGFYYGFTVYAK